MKIVKNNTLQLELEENGFITFPLLDSDRISKISLLFDSVKKEHAFSGKYHHSTFHTGDISLSQKVSEEIILIVESAMSCILTDYEIFVANFMIKEPSEVSEVSPHQDWTYVDEKKFQSFNLWIPLQDVNEENGCLTMLKGSHKLYHSYRPSPQYPGIFDSVMPCVKNYITPVPMKAGEGILFYHSVLHGSFPNLSNHRRLNIVIGLYNKGAQLQHLVFKPTENNIYKYEILKEDFSKILTPGFLDNKHPDSILTPVFPQLSETDFLTKFKTLTL